MFTYTVTHTPERRNSVCFRVYDPEGRRVIQTHGKTVELTLPTLVKYLGYLGLTLDDLTEKEEL